jgi:hypothetical protein
MLSRRIVQSRTSNLDLDVPGCLGNIDRLDTHLTVDNVRFAPCAYLVADDINISTGAWASRHDASKILSVAGSGAAPTYGNVTAIENTAAKYANAKYHAAANTTWGQITTGDGAAEVVFNGMTADSSIFCTRVSGSLAGFDISTASGIAYFLIGDGTDYVSTAGTSAISQNGICHFMAFADKSDKAYFYLNGVYFAASVALTSVGDSTGGNLAVGALSGGASYCTGSVLSLALWNLPTNPFPGVLKNRTYFDKIARERFALVAGIQDRRQGAHTFTRATPAYLDKYETPTSTARWLHRVSSGWPRVCQRKDANGKVVTRALCEPQVTNLATNSEDLATTWTAENLTTITANGQVAANGTTTADGIVANATDTTHGIYGAYTLPATNHCLSAFVEYGNKGWVELYSSITNVSCYFDISNGVVGTAGAAVTAAGVDAQSYKGVSGIYRVWICFTGSADAKNYGVRTAQADGDNTFSGDTTTANTWVWGIQIEATAELFPSSYIPTAAAAVARNKDELSYNVRLPIVGNLNDLPQALTIGGTDYDPCAYLVADDCQVDGTWLSRSTYHANILIDGAMEAADTSYWASGNSATLSKEAGTPHGGSLCLRCARNGTNNPYFVKTGTTIIGKTYRLRGYVRSDGTAIPLVYDSGAVLLFTGTTSTSWQAFDATYVAVGLAPYFWVNTSSGTTYCEWDDITLESEAKLAFAGAGTNPTPNWDAVSRANRSVKYWASNYHTAAADTTWGQVTSGDYAVEVVAAMTGVAGNTMIMSTYNGTTGIDIYTSANVINQLTRGSGVKNNVTSVGAIPTGSIFHAFFGVDESVGSYVFINGVYSAHNSATNTYTDSTGANLSIGALASDGSGAYGERIILAALWDLTANPWPGAATNQAVMGAIARARFNQLFRYQSCRLGCEILHPNVNRQGFAIALSSGNASDYNYTAISTNDAAYSEGRANTTAQWSGAASTDVCNGVDHRLVTQERSNQVSLKVDNATEVTDASCELPAGQSKVFVGQFHDGTYQPTCLVGGVKLWRSDK